MSGHQLGVVPVFQPIALRSETLSERVYEAIRDAIVSRRLIPGERVTEAALATQMSVSKTPVREALLRLEHVGLVKADAGRGVSVVLASPAIIREAFEYRLALEVEACRLTATRADKDSVRAIEELAEASLTAAEQEDKPAFHASDRKLHMEIARACGNPRLAQGVRDVLDLTSALRSRDALDTESSVSCANCHVEIAAAIRHNAEERAASLLRGHLLAVQELVVARFTHDLRTAETGG